MPVRAGGWLASCGTCQLQSPRALPGFAAFESAGYAFDALFVAGGLSLANLVETEVLRGILAPVGHGLWTAILGGALFAAAARHGRPRPRYRDSAVC